MVITLSAATVPADLLGFKKKKLFESLISNLTGSYKVSSGLGMQVSQYVTINKSSNFDLEGEFFDIKILDDRSLAEIKNELQVSKLSPHYLTRMSQHVGPQIQSILSFNTRLAETSDKTFEQLMVYDPVDYPAKDYQSFLAIKEITQNFFEIIYLEDRLNISIQGKGSGDEIPLKARTIKKVNLFFDGNTIEYIQTYTHYRKALYLTGRWVDDSEDLKLEISKQDLHKQKIRFDLKKITQAIYPLEEMRDNYQREYRSIIEKETERQKIEGKKAQVLEFSDFKSQRIISCKKFFQ
ncbi:hypothetical protein N9W41_01460 [bacterium]|nr:hypothetical protein [bacterium]